MDFLSSVASYICIVNLLKHELVGRCDMIPLGIQEEYFIEYSVTGLGIPAHAALASAQAIGNAVVALIFSMAKREVTFLSETVAISRL
jgi:hypothetical protein